MTGHDTGRIEAAALALGHLFGDRTDRERDDRRADAVYVLGFADKWDRNHGIVRVDTRDEATVEKIARALSECDQRAWLDQSITMRNYYRHMARAVLAALRGEG